jgi:hypothetical protein
MASTYTLRRTNPGWLNFVRQRLISFSIITALFPLHTQMYIRSHPSNRKRQIPFRFTPVGPHFGTHFMSTFLRPNFGHGSYIFGKFGDRCICQ